MNDSMIGTRLGPYEITSKLGEGGMGVVWRARDAQLDRDVALKVVPEAFIKDADRMDRFEREAKLLAQLNHSNIAQIHGLEISGETRALVMELVEGPTLADRLDQGALPIEESLAIARKIAEALEEAHRKGIVHRDLKPQNIKASLDGKVKVLDFGLAKAMGPVDSGSGSVSMLAASPTLTLGATAHGLVLGTAAYMAPEQAKGGQVDKRADIWSFGVVLFEMVAGRRLFEAPTIPETLAKVLTVAPDLDELPESIPTSVRRLLRRCLVRDPANRLHDVADARILIDEILEGRDEVEAAELTSTPVIEAKRRGSPLGWIVAVVIASLAAGAVGYFADHGDDDARAPLQFSVTFGTGQELVSSGNAMIAFAPDGQSFVTLGREDGKQMLFRRHLEKKRVEAIPGTEEGRTAFFSPDGSWIGFTAGGKLKKVPVEGGRPFDLADSRGSGGACWLPGDTLVFAPIYSDGLFRVSAQGGEVERLTTPDREAGELGHWWPEPLPGGKKVLFTAFRTPVDRSRIGVLDLETLETSWVVDSGFNGRYATSGHLLFARGKRLFAHAFDPVSTAVTGPAIPLLDDLLVSATGGSGVFAVSSLGTLAYVSESHGDPPRELVWLNRNGNARAATKDRHRYLSVSLSPDGSKAAVTIEEESRDLWIHSLERGTLSRLTSGSETEFDPIWSVDGRELFYVMDRPPFELRRIAISSPDSGRPIWDEASDFDITNMALAPDGLWVAYVQNELGSGYDIHVRPLDGSEPGRAFRASRADESWPSFSPDGRWLVYQSNETGRFEVYVEAFPGPGERFQISAEGGAEAVWSPDGDEIFIRHDDEFQSVEVRLGDPPRFAEPRTLFSYPIMRSTDNDMRTVAISSDGESILAVSIPDAHRPRQVEIITDWMDQLPQLVPKGGP